MSDVLKEPYQIKGAWISSCNAYRYALERIWDIEKQFAVFIMLNPSTADGYQDDPTIRRCVSFARHWGYGGIHVVNLFAYRATNPDELNKVSDPTGKHNKAVIKKVCQGNSIGLVVCAWGSKVPKKYPDRAKNMLKILKKLRIQVKAFKINKDGNPAHPLYLKKTLKPIDFWMLEEL